MDTYADDLSRLIETLDLHGSTLVGHSTGGGEVAPLHQAPRHEAGRQGRADGRGDAADAHDGRQSGRPADQGVRRHSRRRRADRSQFYKELTTPFYGANRPGAKVSQGIRDAFWFQGMQGGLKNELDSIKAFLRDRLHRGPEEVRRANPDHPRRRRPDRADRCSARASYKLVRNATLKIYPGGPHGLADTHRDQSMPICSPF